MSTNIQPINTIVYTDDQQKALNGLITWLKQPIVASNIDSYINVLDGQAGTGKTFILKTILKSSNLSFVATAPTHKATHLLSKSLPCETATIQKLIGLRLSFDIYNVNEKNFTQQADPAVKNYKVMLVDESSMITGYLETLIRQEAVNHKVKVLFVGDKYQLKAVDGHSIFDSGYKTYTLNEIVRQEQDNPLIKLLTVIRKDIQYGTLNFISYLNKNKEDIHENKGYKQLSITQLSKMLIYVYSNEKFFNDIDLFKFLTYTNDTITIWNKYVRNNIFTNVLNLKTTPLVKKDFIMGYDNIVDEYLTKRLINSDEYFVVDVNRVKKDSGYYVFDTVLKSEITGKTTTIDVVDHTDPSFKYYVDILKTLIHKAKTGQGVRKALWKNVFDFKSQNVLMIDYQLYEWDKNSVIKRALDYGYCLTVHKSQGSTYKNVAVNLNDILAPNGKVNTNREQIARLAYVAFSRASHMVYYIT